MGRTLKNIGTYHGAPKVGLAVAPKGVMGPGAAQSGTFHSIDTMGTGRKVSVGSTSMVNPVKIKGANVATTVAAKNSGGSKRKFAGGIGISKGKGTN